MKLRKARIALLVSSIFILSGCSSKENYTMDKNVDIEINNMNNELALPINDNTCIKYSAINWEVIDSIVVRQPFPPREVKTYKRGTEVFEEITSLLKELDGEYMSNSKGMAFETVYIGLMHDGEEMGNIWFTPEFTFFGSSYNVNAEGYRDYYTIDAASVEKWEKIYQELGFSENIDKAEAESGAECTPALKSE